MTATNPIVKGLDISKWQGNVDIDKDGDLDEIVDAGYHFVWMKATEGRGSVDRMFARNMASLYRTRTGDQKPLYPGAYHFARPDSGGGRDDGEAEARDFVKVIKDHMDITAPMLPPALDWEKYSDHNHKENRPWIEGFLDVVESEIGRKCIVYTGINVWKYETGIPKGGEWTDLAWLADRCYLWLVQYSRRGLQPNLAPKKPIPGWPHLFWQYSGGGKYAYEQKVLGKTIDVNRFEGTLEDLRRVCAGPGDPVRELSTFEYVSIAFRKVSTAQAVLSAELVQPDLYALRDAHEAVEEAEAALHYAMEGLLKKKGGA